MRHQQEEPHILQSLPPQEVHRRGHVQGRLSIRPSLQLVQDPLSSGARTERVQTDVHDEHHFNDSTAKTEHVADGLPGRSTLRPPVILRSPPEESQGRHRIWGVQERFFTDHQLTRIPQLGFKCWNRRASKTSFEFLQTRNKRLPESVSSFWNIGISSEHPAQPILPASSVSQQPSPLPSQPCLPQAWPSPDQSRLSPQTSSSWRNLEISQLPCFLVGQGRQFAHRPHRQAGLARGSLPQRRRWTHNCWRRRPPGGVACPQDHIPAGPHNQSAINFNTTAV